MSEKTELEKYAVIEFCKAYREQRKRDLVYVGQYAPPIPDTKCTLDGKIIFIEVAHLYGAKSDAKKLLGRRGRSSPSAAEEVKARLTPLNVRIGGELSRILKKKSEKTYKGEPIWLLIRNANPLWDYSDFESYVSNMTILPKHPFQRIWLLCGRSAESGIIELPV